MANTSAPEPGQRRSVYAWLDERLGLTTIWKTIFDRAVPETNWFYTFGSATMVLCVLQGITGMLLTIYYVPTPDHAFDSIQYIMNEVTFGWLIRGMHHWGATLLVVMIILHLLKAFFVGAYKWPREITWLTGGALLLLVLVMGFSGYLLPWNQRSYWATAVGTSVIGAVPLVGEILMKIARGGTEIGAVTLARFYGLHIWWIPLMVLGLIGLHLYLIIRIGITAPPERDE